MHQADGIRRQAHEKYACCPALRKMETATSGPTKTICICQNIQQMQRKQYFFIWCLQMILVFLSDMLCKQSLSDHDRYNPCRQWNACVCHLKNWIPTNIPLRNQNAVAGSYIPRLKRKYTAKPKVFWRTFKYCLSPSEPFYCRTEEIQVL